MKSKNFIKQEIDKEIEIYAGNYYFLVIVRSWVLLDQGFDLDSKNSFRSEADIL